MYTTFSSLVEDYNYGTRREGSIDTQGLARVVGESVVYNTTGKVSTARFIPHFFFVQVGAHDGITDDPIGGYIRRYGWHGLLLEPLPDVFELLKGNYEGQDGLTFINAAVSSVEGSIPFFRHPRFSQCSGMGVRTGMQRRVAMKEIEVTGITMDTVISQVSEPFGLLQIDTEGFDDQIIYWTPFDRIKPLIIRYEHKHLHGNRRVACENFLLDKGYSLFWEAHDTICYLPLK